MGILFTASALIVALRSLIEGVLADRFGRKPFLFLSNGIITISGIIYAFTCDLAFLLLTSALEGLGSVYLSSPSEQAMLSEKTVDEERTALFSIASFISTVSSMFGAFSAGIPSIFQTHFGFDEIRSYQPVFIIVAFIGFAGVALTIPLREERWKEFSKKYEKMKAGKEEIYEDIGKILSRFAPAVA